MIKDILTGSGVTSFAAIAVSKLKITKPYLLGEFSENAHAVFAVIPYYSAVPSNLASFAAVPDYHRFASDLLGKCADYITAKYGGNACGFADHSPFDEVAGAAMCGLGVIGDHGLLITAAHSSFVTVGELVCELNADELAAEGIPALGEPLPITGCTHCGRCRAVCPTGAIGTNDKSSCLSAITQKKGELTETERTAIRKSPYIWGCDACQLACPYTEAARNAGTLETAIPYFRLGHIANMTAEYLDQMTDEEYLKYTFSWRRRDVMKRNIDLKGDGDD